MLANVKKSALFLRQNSNLDLKLRIVVSLLKQIKSAGENQTIPPTKQISYCISVPLLFECDCFKMRNLIVFAVQWWVYSSWNSANECSQYLVLSDWKYKTQNELALSALEDKGKTCSLKQKKYVCCVGESEWPPALHQKRKHFVSCLEKKWIVKAVVKCVHLWEKSCSSDFSFN